MRRYAYLLGQGLSPQQVMCVTFSNKAAREMSERAAAVLNVDPHTFLKGAWINTFHSLSNRILREHCELAGLKPGYHILDETD